MSSNVVVQDYPSQPIAAVEAALEDALMVAAQKEGVSMADLISTPATVPNYKAPCPDGWTLDFGRDCFAPSSYTGPCVRRKSFSKYNLAEKAEWGTSLHRMKSFEFLWVITASL